MKINKNKLLKILKFLGKVLLGILILFFLIVLFVRSPWGQNIIVNKVTSIVSEKTDTKVEIEKLFITFSGDILLKGLYLEDKKGDTLVYSKLLKADVPIWPIVRGNGIAIDDLEWSGVRANVIREDSLSGFNYQFLIDAFVSTDTTTTVPADTTALDIQIGDVRLADFKLKYNDAVSGMDASVNLGRLDVSMKETNLEAMEFRVGDALLADSNIRYTQTKPLPESEESDEPTAMPKLAIDNLALQNVKANYESLPDGMLADVDLGNFSIGVPRVDLAENYIEIDQIELGNTNILLETTTKSDSVEVAQDSITEPTPFEWPAFTVSINEIDFVNNNIRYFVDGARPKVGTFDANAIHIENLGLQANSISLKNKKASLNLENLVFTEASGFNLKNFGVDINATDQNLDINNLQLALNNNILRGDANLKYSSLTTLIENPENTALNLNLSRIEADLHEVFRFQPDLQNNEYLNTLSKHKITGNVRAQGTLNNIDIAGIRFNWGNSTNITANGTLKNAMDPNNLQFDFPQFKLDTKRTDLVQFVNEEELGISLPEEILLTGDILGSMEKIDAVAVLETGEGNIDLDGNVTLGDAIAFNGDVRVNELQVGKILKNEQFGALNLTIKASGQGATVNELDAKINATVESFHYNGYAINNLALDGTLKNGKGDLQSAYKDENLNMNLNAYVILDSVAPSANVKLNVIGADLQAFGVSSRNVRAALNLDADFKGNGESYDVTSTLSEGIAVYDNQTYLLGDLNARAHVTPDTTSVNITNKMLNLDLESNASPAAFMDALQRHFQTYLSNEPRTDTIINPVKINVRGKVSKAPILNEVLVANLRELDTVNIQMNFDERKRILTADVNMPYINYSGNRLDSLALNVDSDAEHLNFLLGFNEINAGPLAIKKTVINGNVANKSLLLDFTSFYEQEKLLHLQSEITATKDSLQIHINPAELILNKVNWDIRPNNQITWSKNSLEFTDFTLSRNNQSLTVNNKMPNVQKEHIGVNFENFTLASILSYLNPEQDLANGKLSGNFIVQDPFTKPGMLADLSIADFKVMQIDMGRLSLNAQSGSNNNYDFDLDIKEGNIDLDLTGGYQASETAAQLDLNLDLNEVKMKAVEAFSFGEITDGNGSFSGNIQLSGTTAEPQYSGDLLFTDAGFKVAKLNTTFVLPNESLRLDNQGLYFNNFTIQDQNSNTFIVSGDVLTESFLNPVFDLQFKADNFQVLDSDQDDFELFYGKASFDVDASLTGDLELPKLDLTLDVGEDTNVTYVIPPSEVQVESMQGVVIFVNKENPDAILTKNNQKEDSYTLSGFDITARLSIDENAIFNIIIDEETGDNFQVQGSGDLNFAMYPNGRTTLTGRYDLDSGHYEMSLYNLVKRRFEIADGSSVTWSGEIFDADLDVKAYYEVETSASGLMAAQTSGADVSTRNRFRQELPFLVYLNIGGEMLQPKLSFSLDITEEERGAVGGQVYGRVQQLNQQENELNKQVFSLLVLNRFFPDSGSDGSSGGTATIARDNLNDALSDQLNVFSDKLLGSTGVELDFGLDSFTDYQGDSPQERTTLDIAAQKKLLDDRLIVRVGSEVDIQGSGSNDEGENPLVGNVSLEYLLTEDGRFRLKGFRRNEFQNVIDGQIIVSGISLIFTREFNKFDELWRSILNGKKDEDETNNEKK